MCCFCFLTCSDSIVIDHKELEADGSFSFFVSIDLCCVTWDFLIVVLCLFVSLQGNTGVVMGMFLVSFVVLVALVTVLSGIGVCERCSIGSGGVYSMISTVLGGQVGGTIGFLYIFGQVNKKKINKNFAMFLNMPIRAGLCMAIHHLAWSKWRSWVSEQVNCAGHPFRSQITPGAKTTPCWLNETEEGEARVAT